jgi:hypothetical protein
MKVKVISKRKLTECINPVHIHSIIPVKDVFGGTSLAIALKSFEGYDIYGNSIDAPLYGDRNGGGVYFFPLDKFTYHPCTYAAIPEWLYGHILIIKKEWENGQTFVKARITKPVKF